MRLVIGAYLAGGVILLGCCHLAPHLEHALPRAQRQELVYQREDYPTEDFQWRWPRWHQGRGS